MTWDDYFIMHGTTKEAYLESLKKPKELPRDFPDTEEYYRDTGEYDYDGTIVYSDITIHMDDLDYDYEGDPYGYPEDTEYL